MEPYVIFFLLMLQSIFLFAQKDQKEAILKNDSIVLKEVVINGTVPLNDKQIESFYKSNTLTTIDNVVDHLGGMSLIRRGSYAMEPSLNGFSGGQLSLTIDGMKMFGACTDRMDPITSYVEPSNLKSITVEQGSGGCHSGSCVGGSVDMALQEPNVSVEHPFNNSLSIGYESVSNGKTALLSTGYLKNKWQWGLTGALRKHSSYADGSNKIVPFTQYEKSNIHSVLKYEPDSTQSIKADVLFDLAHNVGYAALPMDVGKARAFLAAIEYRSLKANGLTVKLYFNTILHIMDDSKRDSTFYLINKESGQKKMVYMRMDMPGNSSTIGTYIQKTINLKSNNKLTVQVDNYTNHSLAEMTMHMHYPGKPPENPMYLQTWPDILRNVSGVYFQDKWYASQKLIMILCGRLDYSFSLLQSGLAKEQFSIFKYDLAKKYQNFTKNVNASFHYFIADPLSFKLETGYSERNPTIGEQFGFYLYNAYDGYDYIGNPDIQPEKSYFGKIDFQSHKPGLKINMSQSIFLVQDYIMGIYDSTIPPMNFYTNGTRVYKNTPGARVYGTNLQLEWTPVSTITVFMLTKYTWGQLNSGDPLPLIAPLNNVISLSYQKSRLNINLENETALSQDRINANYGETKSPAYTIFNIKGTYHFMITKTVMLAFSVALTNALNALYYEHLDWGEIYRPGRSIDVLMKLTF